MTSPASTLFFESIERILTIDCEAEDARDVSNTRSKADQARLVSNVVQNLRTSILFRDSKVPRDTERALELAWSAIEVYLNDSLGCFDMPGLLRSLRDKDMSRRLPLRSARHLLDVALLHRLMEYYRRDASPMHLEAVFNDVMAICAEMQTAWQEKVIPFEFMLAQDPCGAYLLMDAFSKDAYRDRIETLATQFRLSEYEVAARALRLSLGAGSAPYDHVGYYLFDGVDKLCRSLGYVRGIKRRRSQATSIAVFLILQVSLACALVVAVAVGTGAGGSGRAICYLAMLCLVVADSLKGSVEFVLGYLSAKRPSLMLDFVNDGLPQGTHVIIAVPMHLVSVQQWDDALQTACWNLVQANDTNLELVFLTDFPDSSHPGDTHAEMNLLSHAIASVERDGPLLAGRSVVIHILHRDRQFNLAEGCWMGSERKRGKLALLHRLISHGEDGFSVASPGARLACKSSTYVLCLDEDSRIARNALQRMAGFLAHPLNRPIFKNGRVFRGHVLAIPCVMTDAASLSSWRWPRFSAGPSVDARAKLDNSRSFAYDWFGQAAYSGKGMYVPELFDAASANRIPAGIVLSHDTMEAAWLRPGYVDGALVTDAYPSSFRSFLERQERWIRGDLQNAAILLSLLFVSARRPPALAYFTVMSQLLAWTGNAALFAIFFLLITFDLPIGWYAGAFVTMLIGGYQRLVINAWSDRRLPARDILRVYIPYFVRIHLSQMVRIITLPLHALLLAQAAAVTTWRLAFQRRLLQWRSSSIVDASQSRRNLFSALAWTVSALAMGALLVQGWMDAHPLALILLGAWALSPGLDALLTRSAR